MVLGAGINRIVRRSSRRRRKRFSHFGRGSQRGILGGVVESGWVDCFGGMVTLPGNGAPHGFGGKSLLFISEFVSDAHGIEGQVLREIDHRFQVMGSWLSGRAITRPFHPAAAAMVLTRSA